MSALPWVRFFPSDWLAGTRGMTAAEMGVYISLISMMYERGEPLVEDFPRLARLCGASNSQFRKTLDSLLEDGKLTRKDGGLWNDRVEKEQSYRSEKSEVGKRAAGQRWQKSEQKHRPVDASAMRSQCEGNANQKPEAREEANASSEKRASAQFASEFASTFWPLYPEKVAKPKALEAFIKARRKADLEAIMSGLRQYIATKPTDRSWLNPTTFLNQERWADQHAPANGSGYEQRHSHAPQRRSRQDDIAGGVADFFAAKRLRQSYEASHDEDRAQRPADGNPRQLSGREVTLERGADGSYRDGRGDPIGYGYGSH